MVGFCKTLTKVVSTESEAPFFPDRLVSGHVRSKTNALALVDVGFLQSGLLFNNGSWRYHTLKAGESIAVFIESVNKEGTEILLSRRDLDEAEAWAGLEALRDSGKEIMAEIVGLTRRGIRLEVLGTFGALFWNNELIKYENEIRKRTHLPVRVKHTCKQHNMVVLTLARGIERSSESEMGPLVWTGPIDLCDKGFLTLVDGGYGFIMLSGKP